MSDTHDPFGFGKFVPGFDFLQNLARQPGAGANGMPNMPHMPGMPSWIAPTLDVGEIDKRIEELRAVQFWLDQNATALKATLQALEVQKMTLATLRGMNVSMEEMAEALRAKPTEHPFADMKRPVTPEPAPPPAARAAEPAPAPAAAPEAAPAMVDPMQWWGALSEQFQQIAGGAMQDVARKAGAAGPFAQAFANAPASAPAAAKTTRQAASKTAARKKPATKRKAPARKTAGKSARS